MNSTITSLKSAIIGKAWVVQGETQIIPASFLMPADMTFSAGERYLVGGLSFVVDRNLIKPVTIAANEKLFFYANNKRPGKEDPDYSVSAVLSEELATEIVQGSKTALQAWRDANPVAAVV